MNMESITSSTFGILELKKTLLSMMAEPREHKEPLIQRILTDIVRTRKDLQLLMAQNSSAATSSAILSLK